MAHPIDLDKLYADVWQLRREGRRGEALQLAADALAQVRPGGDTKALARVLCVMGQMERDHGRNLEAADCYLEAVGLYRRVGDRPGLAYALRHACDLLRELGRFSEAGPLGEEGLALYRAMNAAPLDLANMLRVCALLKEDTSQPGEAKLLQDEADVFYQKARVARSGG